MRRTVEDGNGNRYILLKESSDASLVRDPATDERRYLPNDELTVMTERSPLSTAVEPVPESVQVMVTAVHEPRTLGLLFELDAEGPMAVRELLSSYDFCESDLHGMTAELRAAGLLSETTVDGQRGYDTTEQASDALAVLAERETDGSTGSER